MTRIELIEKLKIFGLALKEVAELKDDDGNSKVFLAERAAFVGRIDLEKALLESTKEEIEALTTEAT